MKQNNELKTVKEVNTGERLYKAFIYLVLGILAVLVHRYRRSRPG